MKNSRVCMNPGNSVIGRTVYAIIAGTGKNTSIGCRRIGENVCTGGTADRIPLLRLTNDDGDNGCCQKYTASEERSDTIPVRVSAHGSRRVNMRGKRNYMNVLKNRTTIKPRRFAVAFRKNYYSITSVRSNSVI